VRSSIRDTTIKGDKNLQEIRTEEGEKNPKWRYNHRRSVIINEDIRHNSCEDKWHTENKSPKDHKGL